MILVKRLAQTCLALQVLLVVSGSAVRVTGSGLGCPTWPRCTSGSVTNTAALGGHGYIEFGNRLLAVLLELVGIALVIAVLRVPHPRSWTRLALVQAAVVPVQAVVGGLLVLSGLNPYVLILHFLASFPLILAAAALLQRVSAAPQGQREQPWGPVVRGELRWLTRGLVVASSAVLVLGSLVTGTGPHAGDPKVARLPFSPRDITQLHADLVYLLIGLTIATAVAARLVAAPRAVVRGTNVMIALIAVQGALGYWQYYLGVPPLLVVLHVLGAGLVFTTAAWSHLATSGPSPAGRRGAQPQQTAEPIPVRAAGKVTAR